MIEQIKHFEQGLTLYIVFSFWSKIALTGGEEVQKFENPQDFIDAPKIDKGKGKAKAVEPTEEDGEDDDEEEEDEEDEDDDLVRNFWFKRHSHHCSDHIYLLF